MRAEAVAVANTWGYIMRSGGREQTRRFGMGAYSRVKIIFETILGSLLCTYRSGSGFPGRGFYIIRRDHLQPKIEQRLLTPV